MGATTQTLPNVLVVDDNRDAADSLSDLLSIYGAEAGNVALKFMTYGGLYIGGGIAPKIIAKLRDGTFMRAYLAKGRMQRIVEAMPVHVVMNPNTALLGAARCAVRHGDVTLSD